MVERIYAAFGEDLVSFSREDGAWTATSSLSDEKPTCVAVDSSNPDQAYCGTRDNGVWKTEDSGKSWSYTGDGIVHDRVMAISVDERDESADEPILWAGTEPSGLFRSDDGGESWTEQGGLTDLPSKPDWAFPPRPETHHVRWIEPDPNDAEQLYVALEQGALVHTLDGGETWIDRVPGSPRDVHTLRFHPETPDLIYTANGDGFVFEGQGYMESADGGENWTPISEGLDHQYLWSVAVDSTDPSGIIVSAAGSPEAAHSPEKRESYIYRLDEDGLWDRCESTLPSPEETCAPILTTTTNDPGVIYVLTNQGVYQSDDAGESWREVRLPWKNPYQFQPLNSITVA